MVTKEEAVKILNEIHQLDPTVLQPIIDYRVPCNEALANHPTVQVGHWKPDGGLKVGFLGILNGIFGVNDKGWGWIAAEFSEPPEHKLKGFIINEGPREFYPEPEAINE
jgi:hypothetical protein